MCFGEMDTTQTDRQNTFIIITNRFGRLRVARFSASKSLFLFSPTHPLRRMCVYIMTNMLFDYFIVTTILVNCVFLAMPDLSWVEITEFVFFGIYLLEMFIKIIARGFFMHKFAYLRRAWNWLDFIVIISAVPTMIMQASRSDSSTALNLNVLRTIRVFRIMKTVSILPGLKTIVNALFRSILLLTEVVVLTLFCLVVFAVAALRLYMGTLRQKCVRDMDNATLANVSSDEDFYTDWIQNESNWMVDDEGEALLCGNRSGSLFCGEGYTCLEAGENPNYGYSNFDNFGWSVLNCFQILTLDFWEEPYHKVLLTNGNGNLVFFMVIVFFGSYYLLNLMLAVVAMSYENEAEKAEKARKSRLEKERRRKLADKSAFLFETTMLLQNKQQMLERSFSSSGSHSDVLVDLPQANDTGGNGQEDKCCQKCCKTTGCNAVWLDAQALVTPIVSDPLFDFSIAVLIVLNTVCLASQHHGQPEVLDIVLKFANNFFTAAFVLEAVLKITAYGKDYFKNGWNIFDFVIVMAGILDIVSGSSTGLIVTRAFRLLRLAHVWGTMQVLLTIIINTLGALANLNLVLAIIIYIFAVAGLHLFRVGYRTFDFQGSEAERWHFKDFLHSSLMVFRILCGEWVEAMWQCMRVAGKPCMVVFLPALLIGNFVILNLFLALLLNAFATEAINQQRQYLRMPSVPHGITTIKHQFRKAVKKLRQQQHVVAAFRSSGEGSTATDSACVDSLRITQKTPRLESPVDPSQIDANNSMTAVDPQTSRSDTEVGSNMDTVFGTASTSTDFGSEFTMDLDSQASSDADAMYLGRRRCTLAESMKLADKSRASRRLSIHAGAQSKTSAFGEMSTPSSEISDLFLEPPPCCPVFGQWFPRWCGDKEWRSRRWQKFRAAVLRITENRGFEETVMVIVLFSSIALAFEDIYLIHRPVLQNVLRILDTFFFVAFLIEMLMKWVAYGLHVYFTQFWTLLDFTVVVVCAVSVFEDQRTPQFAAYRAIRAFRALRALKIVKRWETLRIVVNSLVMSIPSFTNVFLVAMVFWLLFSIIGVQLFAGKFYKCVNTTTGERIDHSIAPNKSHCHVLNQRWENSKINFDNVAAGYLALFQLATFEGWMEIMRDGVDAVEVDQQPQFENNIYAGYAFFVIFIIFGALFTLNLFITVVIDSYLSLREKYDDEQEHGRSKQQHAMYRTVRKMTRRAPSSNISVELVAGPRRLLQQMVLSKEFELAIRIIITLNLIVMAFDHYEASQETRDGLETANLVFTVIYTIECVVKIAALGLHYFFDPWNIFDFVIVILALTDSAILSMALTNSFMEPTLLRVLRVIRVTRVLRMVKALRGVHKLLYALIVSLPTIFSIGALLLLIIYIYSIIGMMCFSFIKIQSGLSEVVNFKTFYRSFLVLFRLATAAGWNDVLDGLLVSEPDCDPNFRTLANGTRQASLGGDCGNPWLAIPYMVSYIMIVYMIVINTYIAVILDNFYQTHQGKRLSPDDINMFYELWAVYDPRKTQFIKYDQLSDLLDELDEPMRIPKPNKLKITSLNLSIVDEDKIHCLDVLMALLSRSVEHTGATAEVAEMKEHIRKELNEIFQSLGKTLVTTTTVERQKQDRAARVIQRAWKHFRLNKRQTFFMYMAPRKSGTHPMSHPTSPRASQLGVTRVRSSFGMGMHRFSEHFKSRQHFEINYDPPSAV